MAIVDKLLEFCDATAVNTGAAASYVLGSQVDLGATGFNIGAGDPDVYLVIRTTTEIITGGAAGTVVFSLVSDATAALATDGTSTVHLVSPTYVSDDSAANSDALNAGGTILVAALPYGTYERYLGILQTTGTTALTAGNIDAYLTHNPPTWQAYPDAL